MHCVLSLNFSERASKEMEIMLSVEFIVLTLIKPNLYLVFNI